MKTIRHEKTEQHKAQKERKAAIRKQADERARRELAYYLAEYSAATATAGRA